MKKQLVLAIAVLVMPVAEALTLFGQELSMLVLVPLIVIFIFLLAFAFIIIRDKVKNKQANKESAIAPLPPPPGDLAQLPIEEPPAGKPEKILNIFKPKKKPIGMLKEQQQKPKTDYLGKIEELKKKIPSISIEDANKQLTGLIKSFFSDYAKINYKFTFEELEKELKKRNKKITCFSDNFSAINYSPEGTSKKNLIELLREFEGIVGFVEEESHPLTPQFKKEIEEKKKKISSLLKKGEKSIGKDINKAIQDYKKIYELYTSLTNKEKALIKPLIIDFYNKLD